MTSYLTRVARLSIRSGPLPTTLPVAASALPQASFAPDFIDAPSPGAGSAIPGLPPIIDDTVPAQFREAKPAQFIGFEATPAPQVIRESVPPETVKASLPSLIPSPREPERLSAEMAAEPRREPIVPPVQPAKPLFADSHLVSADNQSIRVEAAPASQPADTTLPGEMHPAVQDPRLPFPSSPPPESGRPSDETPVQPRRPEEFIASPTQSGKPALPAPTIQAESQVNPSLRVRTRLTRSSQHNAVPEPKHDAVPQISAQPQVREPGHFPSLRQDKPASAPSPIIPSTKAAFEQETAGPGPAPVVKPSFVQPAIFPESRVTPSITGPRAIAPSDFPARPSRPETAPPLAPLRQAQPAPPSPLPSPAAPVVAPAQTRPDKPASKPLQMPSPAASPVRPPTLPTTHNSPRPVRQDISLSIGQIDVTVVNQPGPAPVRRTGATERAPGNRIASDSGSFLARHGMAWFQLKG